MTNKNDYVLPPSGNTNNDYVTPPIENKSNDYVTPPSENKNKDYVTPTRNNTDNYGELSSIDKNNMSNKKSGIKSYFDTPKMGFRFYISGYLIWMFIILISAYNGALYEKIIMSIYILFTNYTFCWYTLYQNLKYGDNANLLFKSSSIMKYSVGIASSMNHTTGKITKSWTGGYNIKNRTSIWDTFVTFITTYMVMELLKLLFNIPMALYSAFRHKRNVNVCKQLIK